MEIIPAIDLKGGKCVRLRQGEFSQVETYSEDPVKYALRWQQEGAKRLHVVDLDGARIGSPQPQNLEVIRQITRRLTIPVQLGGGIRTAEIVERMLRIGVDRVILGTTAAQNDELTRGVLMQYGEKVVIGIDAKEGFVAVSGWQERLNESAVQFARRVVDMGAKRIIFTDIGRDGMLAGVNTAALAEILNAVPVPVIASGGVGAVDDVRALARIKTSNLEGVIIGKALYAGTVSLADAIAAAQA
jgi:phosphoribosylformimino-5-aminoimidazole carboxamide ribotide isomerase